MRIHEPAYAVRTEAGTPRVPYTRHEKIQELNKRDVRLVKSVAKHLFFVSEHGVVTGYRTEPSHTLDIIAVIGPGEYRGISFREMVLLEIGYGRSRPYRTARGTNGVYVHKRRRYVSLTPPQLKNVWPSLETCMFEIARAKISLWRSTTTEITARYHVPTRENGLARRKEKERRVYLKGIRFSVSLSDPSVLAAFLKSECLPHRRQRSLDHDLAGACAFITSLLRRYEDRTLLSKKRLAYLNRHAGSNVAMCVDFLQHRKFPPHHLHLILRGISPAMQYGLESVIEYARAAPLAQIEQWGSLLEQDVPTLSGGFIYTITLRRNGEGIRKVYDTEKRKWIARGSQKQDFVVFEVVPP